MANFNQNNFKYISKNDSPFGENPSKYIQQGRDIGMCQNAGNKYLIKRIYLAKDQPWDILPEVQLMDANFSSPFYMKYLDYVLEQFLLDNEWVTRAVYIIMEMPSSDLLTYVRKNGPLDIINLLKLLECIVSFNYDLQKEFDIAHGDIKP